MFRYYFSSPSSTFKDMLYLFALRIYISLVVTDSYSICFVPSNINSVFAAFRLSLLAMSHFRRFSRSEFTVFSISSIVFPAAVKLVSSEPVEVLTDLNDLFTKVLLLSCLFLLHRLPENKSISAPHMMMIAKKKQ